MLKDTLIRIGTIESEQGLRQAAKVRSALDQLGCRTAIVPILSLEGGGESLSQALLERGIDVAVYGGADTPLIWQAGIQQAAVLERQDPYEVFVYKDTDHVMTKYEGTVAVNTALRKAQWLNHYPKHKVDQIEGAIENRLQSLEDHDWNGMVLSGSHLEDLDKLPESHLRLEWMCHAPGQDGIFVCVREDDPYCLDVCEQINHEESWLCTEVERDFIRALNGNHLTPIGASAVITKKWRGGSQIELRGVLLSLDGQKKIDASKIVKLDETEGLGHDCAQDIILAGGKKMLDDIGLQLIKERARRKSVPTKKVVKTRAKSGAKKESKLSLAMPSVDQAKSLAKSRDFISLVSTQKLADEHINRLRDRYHIENLDFVQTVYAEIPPEAVRTDSMIITSPASVKSLLASFPRLNLRFKNIYCVGEATTRLVEERLGRVLFTAPTTRELAIYLCQNMSGRAITYFCSTTRRDDLPVMLAKHHIKVTEVLAYETRPITHKISEEIDGVLFFNPAAVRSYVQSNSAKALAFCMGEMTAIEARHYFKDIKTSRHMGPEYMLQLVNQHFA